MTPILQAAWLALAALMLSGCNVAEDEAPDYRYRLTVEVETPDGLKTGSSVIEVRQMIGRSTMGGFNEQIFYKIRGEAAAVDLPGGRTLYALLRSGDDVEWAARVIPFLAPNAGDENRLDDLLLLKGKKELPRTWPPGGHLSERPAYPTLVTFTDEAEPTSVMLIDPDDLAATFGKGAKLKRVTAELTDDLVTSGIEKRLWWLSEYPEPRLDPNYRGSTNPNLSQSLWHGDFRKGGGL
jgi:hypothetical protein